MIATYVNDRNQKQKISDDITVYVLPFSGTIVISDIESPFVYVNGDSVKIENEKLQVEIQEKSLEIDEYSYAAEPPVQFRLSHLSRRSEPL